MHISRIQYIEIKNYYNNLSQIEKSKMYLDSTVKTKWFTLIENTIVQHSIPNYEQYNTPQDLTIINYGSNWKEKGWVQQYRLKALSIYEDIYKILYHNDDKEQNEDFYIKSFCYIPS